MPSTAAAFATAAPVAAGRRPAQLAPSRAPRALRAAPALNCRTAARMQADGGDAAGGAFDFDAIARKLAADLSAQGIAPPTLPGQGVVQQVDVDEDGLGALEVTTGEGGMAMVILRHKESNQAVEIYTYGAAVTSWKARGAECLWMSELNAWEEGGKAIRGGIPICFVRFARRGGAARRGRAASAAETS
jgi:Aldose 1-epimerase